MSSSSRHSARPAGLSTQGQSAQITARSPAFRDGLDRGWVPWWPPGRQDVTLQRMIVHVIYELARHAGHADIMREQHDGAIGWQREKTAVPDDHDWRPTSPS